MMPVCKHRDSSDEVTMSMYKGEQVLSVWRSCVHWLCWDGVPLGKGSGHACRCSIAALEWLFDKTTGVYQWGACTCLSSELINKSWRCLLRSHWLCPCLLTIFRNVCTNQTVDLGVNLQVWQLGWGNWWWIEVCISSSLEEEAGSVLGWGEISPWLLLSPTAGR